jgi:uracil-DNA glycosylase
MKIYPKKEHIFNAFTTTPISQIKVVIVGQDPYHQPNQAHGLCFSVLKPVPPPPSLKNIYKNLESNKEIDFKKPNHGDLSKWASQGVFLLNASLTV